MHPESAGFAGCRRAVPILSSSVPTIFFISAVAERDRVPIAGIGDRSKTLPYIDAGLGFQYEFSDQWAMQADARRVHGFLHGNTFGFSRSNTNYVNVGLNYSFDRSPEPMRPIATLRKNNAVSNRVI